MFEVNDQIIDLVHYATEALLPVEYKDVMIKPKIDKRQVKVVLQALKLVNIARKKWSSTQSIK